MRATFRENRREQFGAGVDSCARCEGGNGPLCEACEQELADGDGPVPEDVAPLCVACEDQEAHPDAGGDANVCRDCAAKIATAFAEWWYSTQRPEMDRTTEGLL